MEDPRLVNRLLVGLATVVGVACVACSLYLWDGTPLVALIVMTVGVAVAFVVITGIHAVTVWPLVLLIAKLFDDRNERRSAAVRSAEPTASADRGPKEPRED
jgi:hypothetical protein